MIGRGRGRGGDGEPLARTWSGSVGETALGMIRTLAESIRLDVSAHAESHESEDIDVISAFLQRIEANEGGDSSLGCDPRAAEDRGGNGYRDTFPAVPPGVSVCFDIVPADNTTIPSKATPQLFRGRVKILGDGYPIVDERQRFFVVPPAP